MFLDGLTSSWTLTYCLLSSELCSDTSTITSGAAAYPLGEGFLDVNGALLRLFIIWLSIIASFLYKFKISLVPVFFSLTTFRINYFSSLYCFI